MPGSSARRVSAAAGGYQNPMEPIRVGLVADPAAPTQIAQRMTDLSPLDGGDVWDIAVVSKPFTTGSEDVETAVGRLQEQAREQNWDFVVGLTELPLHDRDGRHLLVQTDPDRRTAVLSLPALGGLRMHVRARRAVRSLVVTCPTSPLERSGTKLRSSNTRTVSHCGSEGASMPASECWCWAVIAASCWAPRSAVAAGSLWCTSMDTPT